MMEFQVAIPHIIKFKQYFSKYHPDGKFKAVWRNRLDTPDHLSNNYIQTDIDGKFVLQYMLHGKDRVIPFDVKMRVDPERVLHCYSGDLTVTSAYNYKMHVDRFNSEVSIRNKNPALEKYYLSTIQKLKHFIKQGNIEEIQNTFHHILCNPLNTSIFPSMILQIPYHAIFALSEQEINLLIKALNEVDLPHIAKLFPQMGQENLDNFSYEIERFMEVLPREISMLDKYASCIKLVKDVATITQ